MLVRRHHRYIFEEKEKRVPVAPGSGGKGKAEKQKVVQARLQVRTWPEAAVCFS